MPLITSRAHTFFKQLIKLEKSSHYRKKNNLTLLDGIHLVSAYQSILGQPIKLVMSQSSSQNAEIKYFLSTIENQFLPNTITLSDALFHQVSPVKTPTGIMALISIPEPQDITISVKKREPFYVLLEMIQDPGNLGSILRSAAAAGVSDAYLSAGCTDAWAPKTLRAAMGAHFLLRIHERSNLVNVARQFKGKVITTLPQAPQSLYQLCLTDPVAFIFGNEGKGLSNEGLLAASEQVTIPMLGQTESLNVAAAAAVCLFERVRQCINIKK